MLAHFSNFSVSNCTYTFILPIYYGKFVRGTKPHLFFGTSEFLLVFLPCPLPIYSHSHGYNYDHAICRNLNFLLIWGCSIPDRFSPPKRKKSRRSQQRNPTARSPRMTPSASGERMFSPFVLARGLSTLIKAPTLARLSKLTLSKPKICCSYFSAKAPLVKSSPVKNINAADEGSPIGKKRKNSRKLVVSSDEEENVSPKYNLHQTIIIKKYLTNLLIGPSKNQQM